MPYITDRFGHRLRVPEWPSQEGMAILRRHYKEHHPRAFREMIKKGVQTRRERYNQPFRYPDEDETGPTDYPPPGRSVWCKRCHGISEEGELSPEGYCVECVLILDEIRGNPCSSLQEARDYIEEHRERKHAMGRTAAETRRRLRARGRLRRRDNPSGHVYLDPSLGPRLHEWHEGQDILYRVGSLVQAGRPVPVEMIVEAHHELERLMTKVQALRDPGTLDRDLDDLMVDLALATEGEIAPEELEDED